MVKSNIIRNGERPLRLPRQRNGVPSPHIEEYADREHPSRNSLAASEVGHRPFLQTRVAAPLQSSRSGGGACLPQAGLSPPPPKCLEMTAPFSVSSLTNAVHSLVY